MLYKVISRKPLLTLSHASKLMVHLMPSTVDDCIPYGKSRIVITRFSLKACWMRLVHTDGTHDLCLDTLLGVLWYVARLEPGPDNDFGMLIGSWWDAERYSVLIWLYTNQGFHQRVLLVLLFALTWNVVRRSFLCYSSLLIWPFRGRAVILHIGRVKEKEIEDGKRLLYRVL